MISVITPTYETKPEIQQRVKEISHKYQNQIKDKFA